MRWIQSSAVFLAVLVGCLGYEIRPLYIAGFMANSIKDVDDYIAAGANVIEADLLFDQHSGHATEFFKGYPCDCFRLCHKRESIINYLEHIKHISTPGNQAYKPSFTGILLIDAKLSTTQKHAAAGIDMARLLARYLFNNDNKAKVVIDVAQPLYWPFVDALIGDLKQRGRDDILPKIGITSTVGAFYQDFIQKASETGLGLWMGDGISNCLEDFFHLTDVKEACKLRDGGRGVSKVIRWTTDLQRNIRNAMWLGVDIIGTNDVHDVLAVIREAEFRRRYRLATSSDDPFARVRGSGAYRYGCYKPSLFSGSYKCWKDKDANGNWCKVNQDCTNNKSGCDGAVNLACN